MTPKNNKPSTSRWHLRAFGLCFWLVATLLWLTPLPTHAQTGTIQVTQNTAKVRYRTGIEFRIAATVTGGGEVTSAKLQLKFGKHQEPHVYDVPFGAGFGSHSISDDDDSLVTGMRLTYSWLLSNGKVQLQLPQQTVVYEDTSKNWFEREGEKVTLRWYAGDDRYGNLMYQLAADSIATYKRRFNFDPTDQIYISIYGSSAAYHNTFPDVPTWSGGFSRYGGVEIVAIAPDNYAASVFIGEGIPHELSHATIYQFLRSPAPRWLDEGFAVYNQNTITIKEYDDLVKASYKNNTLLPLNSIDTRWPADADSAMLAYAEGRSIVTFLINTYGNQVWSNLLDQLRRHDADGAFQAVFGVNVAQMEELWKNKVLGGLPVNMPVALKSGAIASQPSEDDLRSRQSEGLNRRQPNSNLSNLFGIIIAILCVLLMTVGVAAVIVMRRRSQRKPVPGWIPGGQASYYDEDDDPYVRAQLATYTARRAVPADALPSVPAPLNPTSTYGTAWPVAPEAKRSSTFASDDPFDFIVSSFGSIPVANSTPEPKTNSSSFLDIDPYGLNFGSDDKEKGIY